MDGQAIQAPFYKLYPEAQVRATLVAEQVWAPVGQTMQDPLTNEYPTLQVRMVLNDEQVAAFLLHG